MTLVKAVQFSHNSIDYEIKVFSDDMGGYSVKSFLKNGKRANPYNYTVDSDTEFQYEWDKGLPAYEHLIEYAANDIKNDTWRKYFKAVQEE
ncbi:MAG: hypothetical protein JXR70_09030 [Spirochaetales bacterium]|nr:hypothetical protein [Spirochaetales bacterium]